MIGSLKQNEGRGKVTVTLRVFSSPGLLGYLSIPTSKQCKTKNVTGTAERIDAVDARLISEHYDTLKRNKTIIISKHCF